MSRKHLTPQEADKEGLMQLTEFDNRGSKMSTQYGIITHGEWVEKEYDRIMSNPERSGAIVIMAGGKVALYVNRVAGAY
jgi:hypothetical protein